MSESPLKSTAAGRTTRVSSWCRLPAKHVVSLESPSSLFRQRDRKQSEELPDASKPMRVRETPQDEQLSGVLWTRTRRHWR